MPDKINVDGIILVLSCRKFEARVKRLVIPKTSYQTLVVVGDPSIEDDYILRRSRKTGWYYLTIRCEDSYIFLFKKLIMTIDVIFDRFVIKEGGGIFRICDDVVFNYSSLDDVLFTDEIIKDQDIVGLLINLDTKPKKQPVGPMVSYYQTHPVELAGLRDRNGNSIDMDFIRHLTNNVPLLMTMVLGHLIYFSQRFAKFMSMHFHEIECMDVFHKVKIGETIFWDAVDTYPFFIEDVAISYCGALYPGLKLKSFPMTEIRTPALAVVHNDYWELDK